MARQKIALSATIGAFTMSLALLTGCSPTGGPSDPLFSSPSLSPSASPIPSPSSSPSPSPTPSPTPEPVLELPRGGTELFPDYRLVGFSGHPYSPGLGRLGIGNIDERVVEIEGYGAELAGGRKVMPVLELITVVVQASPGADGKYRARASDEIIQSYLDTARKHDGMLLLNVQPGRSSMTEEVKGLEKWLREPDVGVALDPEWDITDQQLPGRSYGHTTGEEINEIAAYIDGLVAKNNLPQKPVVFHQVALSVVSNEAAIMDYDGVEIIKSVDGIGASGSKTETYNVVTRGMPATVHAGFKLFFEEDAALGPLMTPAEVLALVPQPEYVLYE